MGLQTDQEFLTALRPFLQSRSGNAKPAVHDILARRAAYDVLKPSHLTLPADVSMEIIHVEAADGYQIPIYHIRRQDWNCAGTPSAAVVHMHGGGLIALSPEISVQQLSDVVSNTGIQAFSVDYRLAPEYRYPTALNDCWGCLNWLHENAKVLGIDTKRIAVMGESAGGGLAAALAIRARDADLSPPIAQQILSAPMLDDRTTGVVPGNFNLWDAEDNLTAWTAYLGRGPGGEGVPALAAPGRLTDATGLPPLYLEVTQLDLFVQEDVSYVQKFVQAGVQTECHVHPGLPHGFDGLHPTHPVGRQLEANRTRVLRDLQNMKDSAQVMEEGLS